MYTGFCCDDELDEARGCKSFAENNMFCSGYTQANPNAITGQLSNIKYAYCPFDVNKCGSQTRKLESSFVVQSFETSPTFTGGTGDHCAYTLTSDTML